jgi:hypothetical protein
VDAEERYGECGASDYWEHWDIIYLGNVKDILWKYRVGLGRGSVVMNAYLCRTYIMKGCSIIDCNQRKDRER